MSGHESAPKRYAVLVQLGRAADRQRLAEAGLAFNALVKRWSRDESTLLCASGDGLLFGFLLKSTLPVDVMRAEFQKSPATRNEDSLIILEIGADFTGIGFSRAWTWLQRH